MKKTSKVLLITIFLLIVILASLIGIIIMKYYHKNNEIEVSTTNENNVIEEENDVIVVNIDGNKEDPEPEPEQEPEPEPEPEPKKDAATITQEMKDLNSEIGTLYIPKTNLTTQVFSWQTSEMMEKMPCYLYGTGELNKNGVSLITGHNRRNGKLFSNNKKLAEGDEFYFTDYEGVQVKYIIYSVFVTNSGDTSFLNTPSEDKPIMALSCCTDRNNDERIIVLGKGE